MTLLNIAKDRSKAWVKLAVFLGFLAGAQTCLAAGSTVGIVKNIYANASGTNAFLLDVAFDANAIAECPNFNGYAAFFTRFDSGIKVMEKLMLKSFEDQIPITVNLRGCTGRNGVWLSVYSISASAPPP